MLRLSTTDFILGHKIYSRPFQFCLNDQYFILKYLVSCLVILSLLSGQFVSVFTSNLLTRSETDIYSSETKTSRTMTFTNYNEGLLGSNAALATNATIFGKDIIIDASSADLFNSGSIIASNNLTLNIGSLSSASINSGNLATTSLADIAKIKAGNDLTITANSLSLPIISSSDLSSNVATTFKGLPLGSSSSDITTTTSEPTTYSGLNFQNTYLSSGGVTKLSSISNINISNDKNLKLATLSSLIPSLNNGDSGSTVSTDGLLFAASIKDDAAAARSALTFNAGSDIELESAGSINIANNYTNSGGSIFLTATDNINNSNFQISAGENVVMQGNNVNNIATANNSNETKIESGNIVSINAIKTACSGSDDGCSNGYKGGNITNIGATISGGSLVYLTADNNITNKALVQYNINGTNSYSSGLSSGQTAANFSNTTLDNNGISASDTNVQSSSADHIASTLISQGNITSGGDLVLVAVNNLNNIGSNITSTGSSYLEATNGNINVTAIAMRDRSVTRWGGSKKGGVSVTDNTTNIASNITSGSSGVGTLEFLATSDLTNGSSASGNINITGSNITSADNLTLTAQNDVNIASAQDTTYSFSAGRSGRGKSYLNQSNSTTQIASDITTTNNGDITITSGYNNTDTIGATNSFGNLNITASTLTTSDTDNNAANNVGSGDVNLTARNDLVISSDLNTSYVQSLSGKKSFSTKRTNLQIDSSTTNVASEISGNDITTTSGNDTYVIASGLTGLGNGVITAGKYTDASDNIFYNSDATLNVISAADEKYHYAMSQKISTDYVAIAVAVVAAVAVGALTGGVGTIAMAGASGAMIGSEAKKTKTSTEMTYDSVQKASELNFAGNLKTESGSDTNIISSNLSADQITINVGKITDENGDLQTINSNANLNIATIADVHISQSSVKKTHANYLAVAATSAAVAGISIGVGQVAATGAGVIGTAVAGQAVGNYVATAMFYGAMAGTSLSLAGGAADASKEFSENSNYQMTQTQAASNITAVGNLNLLSARNINISASNIQTTTSGDINLTSEIGDVLISAGINSTTISNSSEKRDFDDITFSNTNSSVGVDFVQSGNQDTNSNTQTSLAQSNVVSANNININSGSLLSSSSEGGSANILASTLSADNQININANDQINIKSQEEVTNFVSKHSDITNTITLSVGNSWLGLAQNTLDASDRVSGSANSQTDDKAKAANATAASAQIGMNVLQAIVTAPSFGFYGAVTETLSRTTSTSETNYITNVASNLYATNDINLTANSDLTIKGSNVYSENGDINLRSKEGNVIIAAAQNSVNSSSSSETDSISETVSVSGGGVWVNIPTILNSRSSSDYNATSYLSSNISAANGTININAKEDTDVVGSSVLAKDVTITTNNLNVESLQSKLTSNSESDSYSFGGNIGFNNSYSSQDRLWTDNVASIIGTNSVTINTENNTNIVGAVIANSTNGQIGANGIDGGNLTINTKTLTYSNLQDHNNSDSNSIGINVGLPVGFGGSPSGLLMVADVKNTNLGLSYAANSSNQTGESRATIGQGTINLNSNITRDLTTGEVTSITNQETVADNDSRISNLNRDIQASQIDNGTHYEGGYNIDLNISAAVLSRAYELHQNGQLLQEAKTNLGGTAKLYGEAAVKAYEVVSNVAQDIYREVGVIFTPEQQAQVNQAVASGNAQKIYELIEARGISLSDETKEKIRQKVEGEVGGNKFLAGLTDEERATLVQKNPIGLFFDGTGNDAAVDALMGEETNVFRMFNLYVSDETKAYIKGIGTDGGLNYLCQGFGCGASEKERDAMNAFLRLYAEGGNQPFVITDLVGFSRGAATARDFGNLILRDGVTNSAKTQTIPSDLIILRSETLFDTVGSFGWPGNSFDLGKNFSTPSDTIVTHAIAGDESRMNFDLQSIKPSADSILPANWSEKLFPGVHSDVGGGYANSDISRYTLNWAVNTANQKSGEAIFKMPNESQQPSPYLNSLMNLYDQAQANQDKTTATAAESIFKDKLIHDNIQWYNPANWSFGNRDIFYPNSNQQNNQGKDVPINQSSQAP